MSSNTRSTKNSPRSVTSSDAIEQLLTPSSSMDSIRATVGTAGVEVPNPEGRQSNTPSGVLAAPTIHPMGVSPRADYGDRNRPLPPLPISSSAAITSSPAKAADTKKDTTSMTGSSGKVSPDAANGRSKAGASDKGQRSANATQSFSSTQDLGKNQIKFPTMD
jgi:hypothetical protein